MTYLVNGLINFNIPEFSDARSLLPESLIEGRKLKLNKIPILIMWFTHTNLFYFSYILREGIAWLISCNAFPHYGE